MVGDDRPRTSYGPGNGVWVDALGDGRHRHAQHGERGQKCEGVHLDGRITVDYDLCMLMFEAVNIDGRSAMPLIIPRAYGTW